MRQKRTTDVIKVPLPSEYKYIDRPKSFPKMPRLYLELLENKNKIKQELVNKEYIPKETNSHNEIFNPTRNINSYEKYKQNEQVSEDMREDRREDRREDMREDRREDSRDDIDGYTTQESSYSKDISSPERTPQSGDEIQENKSNNNSDNSSQEEDADSDDLSIRLKELLNETDEEKSTNRTPHQQTKNSPTPASPPKDKYVHNYTPVHRSIHRSAYKPYYPHNAPTLAELQEKGTYKPSHTLPDMGIPRMGDEELQDSKRELLFKFDLLKKSYPSATIPEFSMHADYSEMEKTYDSTVRRLTLDSNVENYKQYLLYGFMGVEFVMGNFLGFDMEGFTQQQVLSMNTYEKLLIELGEKSYVPKGSKWPVELRLVFTIIMNAAVFIVGKMIMKKTGANLMGMLNSVTSSTAQSRPSAKKRKMRGPNIDLDDLPDIDTPSAEAGG